MPSTGLPVQQRANPNASTEEQITEIKRLVQDSVAAAAGDIAREAARTATGVLQSQAPSSSQVTPSAQAVSQDTPGGAAILGPQEQQQPLQTLQSVQPNDGSLTSTPCRHGAPFQEIPVTILKKSNLVRFLTFQASSHKTCHCMAKRTMSRCHLKIL